MIVLTLGLTVTGDETCCFTDVEASLDESDPFYPYFYVALCAEEGIPQGTAPTTFDPSGNLSRRHLISMVARAANLPEPPADYVPGFTSAQFGYPEHYANACKAAYAGTSCRH
jgi:hypothetical protein